MRSIRPSARRVDLGRPEQIEGDCVREVAKLRSCIANQFSISTFSFCLCLYSRAKDFLQSPRLSMWHCKRTGGRFPPRRSQRVMAYPRAISNRCSNPWCASASSRASAARMAVMSWRVSAAAVRARRQSRASGSVSRRAGVWTGAEPHQSGRHGAPCRTSQRQSRSRQREVNALPTRSRSGLFRCDSR